MDSPLWTNESALNTKKSRVQKKKKKKVNCSMPWIEKIKKTLSLCVCVGVDVWCYILFDFYLGCMKGGDQ